jgi:ribosomal protein S14
MHLGHAFRLRAIILFFFLSFSVKSLRTSGSCLVEPRIGNQSQNCPRTRRVYTIFILARLSARKIALMAGLIGSTSLAGMLMSGLRKPRGAQMALSRRPNTASDITPAAKVKSRRGCKPLTIFETLYCWSGRSSPSARFRTSLSHQPGSTHTALC